VRLKIHHGGMFIYKPSTVYVNGHIVEEEWGWDVDTMSYIDLTKVIKSIGYKAFKCLWYKHPQKALCRRLKPLNGDCWISPAVTFWSTFSLYKYVQAKSNFLETGPDHQVMS